MESLENLIDYLISKKAPDIRNPVIIFESDKDNNLYPSGLINQQDAEKRNESSRQRRFLCELNFEKINTFGHILF